MGDFVSRIRDFVQNPRQVAVLHGLIFHMNAFNTPRKAPFMGKRSIHIINKISLGLFLRLLIKQDGILLA
jgi:hypothetical protein